MRTFTDKAITRQLPMKRLSEANKRKMLKQAQQAETITMSRAELERMKMQWTMRAFTMTLYFSIMALRDGFGFGKDRLERFTNKFFTHYRAYDADYVTVEDMQQAIKDETGFEIK